ncbi:restriction endonuclease subunit S [Paratractidigestivibacter faecalis]|uniref:restriction endonuclease subunit S n=1 Tax=Paratractidigestivibacter faecalis TaxID=2292441 RepID=UPI003AB64D79
MSDVEKNIGTHKPEFAGERGIARIPLGRLLSKAPTAKCGRRNYPVLSATKDRGIIFQSDRFSKQIASADKSGYRIVERGQLVMTIHLDQGVLGVQRIVDRGIVSPAYKVWDINENLVRPAYLEAALKSPRAIRYFKERGQSTVVGRCNVPDGELLKMPISLPPFVAQDDAISTLTKLNELVEMGRGVLNTLDDLVKSQFVEMFGDTYSNSKQLPSRKLGALIDFITSGSRGWSKYYSDEGDYFITIKNVRGCSISLDNVQHVHAPNNKETERTKVQSGDVLISITANLGRTGVVSKEIADHGAYINQHLACIRLAGEDILPLYLSFFLESPGAKDQLQRKNQTGVKAGLNFDLVKSLDILVPPLALQQQFADFVARVDKLGFRSKA